MQIQPSFDVLTRHLPDRVLVLHQGAVHTLSAGSALVWSLVGSGASVEEVVAEVVARTGALPGEVTAAIEQLCEADLLRKTDVAP